MNEFVFETTAWESYLDGFHSGDQVPADVMLTMLEDEDEDTIESIFQDFAEQSICLDMTSFPKPASLGQAGVRLKQEEAFASTGLHLADLDSSDPLRVYLEEIAAIPACGDEELLAVEHAAGQRDHAAMLTNLGLSAVVEQALSYTGCGVLLLDLIQEGSIGLWQSIQTYTGGGYADHRDRLIRNALEKAVFLQAHSSGIGQKLKQSLQDYRSADEKLLMELGRNPTVEEIAEELHITAEETMTVQKMMGDALLMERVEKTTAPAEEAQEENLAVEDTAYFQMRQRIGELLSVLTSEDAQLLTMRFGLEKGLPMTAQEVAAKLGITAAEVTAREAAALSKLRGNLS